MCLRTRRCDMPNAELSDRQCDHCGVLGALFLNGSNWRVKTGVPTLPTAPEIWAFWYILTPQMMLLCSSTARNGSVFLRCVNIALQTSNCQNGVLSHRNGCSVWRIPEAIILGNLNWLPVHHCMTGMTQLCKEKLEGHRCFQPVSDMVTNFLNAWVLGPATLAWAIRLQCGSCKQAHRRNIMGRERRK